MKTNETIVWRKVAAAMRGRRLERGLTIRSLASELHLSAATICRLEAGRPVSADAFIVAARWLDLHPALFLK